MTRLLHSLLTAVLLFAVGCKEDGSAGGTEGVALYVFDSTSNSVMVWNDLSALYDSATVPAPSYTFGPNVLKEKVSNLAWGGMCLDAPHGILYLVSETGAIVRWSNIRSQASSVPSNEIVSFSLDNSSRLTNGTFGQVAIDSQTDTLLITETGDNGTRIWIVANASQKNQNDSIPLGTPLQMTGDKGGTGVAASGGIVYAYMDDGDSVVGPLGEQFTGSRLRKGSTSAFDPTLVMLGDKTGLHKYGSLALDTAGGRLFVGVHNTDASVTTAPIQVFQTGQFGTGGYNQAPTLGAIGSPTDQATLRVLSHAGTKDWLAGLRGQGSAGYPTVLLWKSPLGGTAAKVISLDSSVVIKGVALDGNAS
ncbi:MAG TPA: hypothetical protein VJ486_13805 [Geothrix sp.]|nr:hypothetical protein [Geothrix sp.]